MKEVCGTCKHNKRTYDGHCNAEFCCGNENSDNYAVPTFFDEMNDFKTKFCEYCNPDSDGYVKPLEKNSHAFIRFGMNGWEISLQAKGWHGECKIRYCPMCGRDLLVK